MKYVKPFRAKVLIIMFFGTGLLGIMAGLLLAPPSSTVMITFMGVINLGLGVFFIYILFTQKPPSPDKRKKKRKDS